MEEIIQTNTEEVAVQEPAVEAQEAVETPAEQAEETTTETVENPVESHPQTRAENQQFKRFRQEREQMQKQMAEMQEANARLMESLKGYGYEGTPDEVALAIDAQRAGVTTEEMAVKRQQEQERLRQMMQNDPEYLELKEKAEAYEQQAFANVYKADLEAINKAFPDMKVKSIEELGSQFATLRANGVDAVTAVAAINQAKQATAKPVPPVMGALNSNPAEKDFYSSKEVDDIIANHPEMLDDEKIMKVIRKSMTKWR